MKTLLIDASSLGYAAAYTLGELSYEDVPTGVIYGFLSRMLSLGLKFQSSDWVVCWDSSPSYRRETFPEYKRNRTKEALPAEQQRIKDAIHRQLDVIRDEVCPALSIANSFYQQGLEADDLIASAVKNNRGHEFVIISPDDDLLQLLGPGVSRYSTTKRQMLTAEAFTRLHRIPPRDWAKVKAIAGCSGDNVPGIKGIGEKKAVQYLNGTMNPKTASYQKIKSEDGRKTILRNKQLVLLPHKATNPVLLADPVAMNRDGLVRIAARYGIDSFLEGPGLERWVNLISGNFPDKQTSSIEEDLEMRGPQRRAK